MANQLEWKDRYNLGIERIDEEHRKLFRIVNKLRAFSEEENKASWGCQEGIKYFKSYALKHFAEEEAHMASISYEDLEVHKRLHEDFRVRRLPAIERELEETKYSNDAITHLRGFCTGWLIEHIEVEDQAIIGRGISKWVNLFTEAKLDAVQGTLTELLSKTFGQEPKLLTQYYGGEEFGEGIYYRLIYGTLAGEKQEIILVFEKKLLISMMEKMTDDPQERNIAMQQEAMQSVAKELEDMKQYFPAQVRYELKGENQLTHDQFHRAMQRQLPKFSLLFDTGRGYFGYCAMTPHRLRREEEDPEKEGADGEQKGSAVAEKEPDQPSKKPAAAAQAASSESPKGSDASEERAREKKKVLVVDDSQMVRQVMKGLLQNDYQVSLAGSAISAIRMMSLERPDLILLDYNMPICDGALMLEMMRSEEDFENIPVIFLTATIDKSSVKRVVPLKPEGYLLKSMKPIEIKKKVDSFFARKNRGNASDMIK